MEERGFCCMRFEKYANGVSFDSSYKHNYRINDVPNADPSMSHLNEELVRLNAENYDEALKNRINSLEFYQKGGKIRSNAVLALEIITSLSKDDLKHVDVEQWKSANVSWLKKTFNPSNKYGDNVLSVVYHGDENGNVHCHSFVSMIDDKGKLNASYFINGKRKLVQLQNSYANAMKQFGLKRGLHRSVAKHEDIKRFYAAVNKSTEKELPPIERKETAEQYRKRANEVYIDTNLKHLSEIKKMERKIVEARTYDLQDRIDIGKEQLVLERELKIIQKKLEKYEDLERVFGPSSTIQAKLTTLHALNDGMGEYIQAFPSEEQAIRDMRANMQKVISYKKKKNQTNISIESYLHYERF